MKAGFLIILTLILLSASSGTTSAAILSALSTCFPATPGAHVYYVAPGGSDSNPGTMDLPWATLQHAADVVMAGDEVIVLDGSYAGFASAHNAVVDRFTPDRSDTILTLQEWQQLGYDAGSFMARPADLFADITSADYRLRPEAGAVDAGLAEFAGYAAPQSDIAGVKRPAGVAVDIGAYEFAPTLTLRGAPANQAIYLNWSVSITLPATSTWQVDYASQTGTVYLPITGILSSTRAYTLTGLTNYVWYTVTLSTSPSFLTDTVRVMPTNHLAYLPLVLK